MTTFPTLTPSGRAFTPGEYPHTSFQAYNGLAGRVRHSNVMLTSQLRLTFTALTEADMLSILSHYNGQYGTYSSFGLPSAVWAGAAQADYELANYRWRYIDSPVVEDVYRNRYTVELTIETVPPDGAATDGGYLTARCSFTGGSANATNGLNKTVSVAFAASGPVFGGVAFSLAYGIGAANGYNPTVTATFTPGAAQGSVSTADYWNDMSLQLYSWESLAYIEWWGN
jgi:hypothetical protein